MKYANDFFEDKQQDIKGEELIKDIIDEKK